jgi:hypothetical protein
MARLCRFVPALPRFITTALTLLKTGPKIDVKGEIRMTRNRIVIKTGVKAGDQFMGSGG